MAAGISPPPQRGSSRVNLGSTMSLPIPIKTTAAVANPHPAPVIPQYLADAGLIAMPGILVLTTMSKSAAHKAVRDGTFPAPVISGPRFTRWACSDVHQWLLERSQRSAGNGVAA
jgi:predicted DNA-binding transcriptional regulator AlpA